MTAPNAIQKPKQRWKSKSKIIVMMNNLITKFETIYL